MFGRKGYAYSPFAQLPRLQVQQILDS